VNRPGTLSKLMISCISKIFFGYSDFFGCAFLSLFPPNGNSSCESGVFITNYSNALIISLEKAGISAGVLEVIRFPSTTTSSSTQLAPAFIISSFIAEKEVALFPLSTFADAKTHPP